MSRETFTIPGTDIVLRNVHPQDKCLGEFCVIHNPSSHHMRDWRLHWRDDRSLFERICPHRIGHPDPDGMRYYEVLGMDFMGVHGCDGCCAEGGASVTASQDVDGPSQGGNAALSVPQGVLVP